MWVTRSSIAWRMKMPGHRSNAMACRGEFYDSETYNGKAILVRFVWTINSPDSCHWEQAFSVDGARTWETNFIWDLTRKKI